MRDLVFFWITSTVLCQLLIAAVHHKKGWSRLRVLEHIVGFIPFVQWVSLFTLLVVDSAESIIKALQYDPTMKYKKNEAQENANVGK
jgi:hypothetical protein